MSDSVAEARAKMIAKRFGGNKQGAKTGGAGSMRLKAKGKSTGGADDKKLSGVLKKMQMQPMNNLLEVNIFKNDGNVIHIKQPKIQASIPCNTYQVSGHAETKNLTELLPDILNQLGPESMDRLREYASSLKPNADASATVPEEGEDSDDEEVPDLVENFDEVAQD